MLDIRKIRRHNLQSIVDDAGGQKALAKNNKGINPTYVSQIVRDTRPMGEKSARNFEQKLGLSAGWFDIDRRNPAKVDSSMSYSTAQTLDMHSNVEEPHVPYKAAIPVVSWVNAGAFSEAIDIYQPGYADEWVHSDVKCSDSSFALIIKGDSMEPRFHEGDRIIVDPNRSPEIGDFVVAKHNGDNEATFKRYVKDGSNHLLIPLNPMYSKIVMNEETEIIGVAISRLPPVERLK